MAYVSKPYFFMTIFSFSYAYNSDMKKIIYLSALILIPLVVSFLCESIVKNFSYVSRKSEFDIRVKRDEKIESVDFEDYIVGVVASEMSYTFEEEALKAQAVAARSYALTKINDSKNKDFDVVDTVYNQVYSSENELKAKWGANYEEGIEKIKKAVSDTKGEILTYDGEVIEAFFFSTSAGKTANSEDVFLEALPYLRSVSSPYDTVSPAYETKYKFTKSDFYKKLNLKPLDVIKIEETEVLENGLVKKITLNNYEYKGSEVVSALSLRSSYFTIKQVSDEIIVSCKGFGHNVGMSQYGANGMAKKGYTYSDILTHYYTDVFIQKI